eukprot:m.80700 g.80700  ORF g.80700 m.80700 type:complete len:186 (+) comp14559_c0_seq2:1487-2044(+)
MAEAMAANVETMQQALKDKNYEQAIVVGKKLLEENKNNMEAYQLLASAYQSHRDYNLAEQTVRRGLKIDRKHQGLQTVLKEIEADDPPIKPVKRNGKAYQAVLALQDTWPPHVWWPHMFESMGSLAEAIMGGEVEQVKRLLTKDHIYGRFGPLKTPLIHFPIHASKSTEGSKKMKERKRGIGALH